MVNLWRLTDLLEPGSKKSSHALVWRDRLRLLFRIGVNLKVLHETGEVYGHLSTDTVFIARDGIVHLQTFEANADANPRASDDVLDFGVLLVTMMLSEPLHLKTGTDALSAGQQVTDILNVKVGGDPHLPSSTSSIKLSDPNLGTGDAAERHRARLMELLLNRSGLGGSAGQSKDKESRPKHSRTASMGMDGLRLFAGLCARALSPIERERPSAGHLVEALKSVVAEICAKPSPSGGGGQLRLKELMSKQAEPYKDHVNVFVPSAAASGYASDVSQVPPARRASSAALPLKAMASAPTRTRGNSSMTGLNKGLKSTSSSLSRSHGSSSSSSNSRRIAAPAPRAGRPPGPPPSTPAAQAAPFLPVSQQAMNGFEHVFATANEQSSARPLPSLDRLARIFSRQERLTKGQALSIVLQAEAKMREEPNVLQLQAPFTLVGDIHGQFFDLLNLFDQAGVPGPKPIPMPFRKDTPKWRKAAEKKTKKKFLFLGDYVDRGHFSMEVLLFLLVLKVTFPESVYMLRGNHETEAVASYFGFRDECESKYGKELYLRCLACFQAMPIAAVISTDAGRIFSCHGGISPNVESLATIEQIDRFREPGLFGPLCDLLWADPVNADDVTTQTADGYDIPNYSGSDTDSDASSGQSSKQMSRVGTDTGLHIRKIFGDDAVDGAAVVPLPTHSSNAKRGSKIKSPKGNKKGGAATQTTTTTTPAMKEEENAFRKMDFIPNPVRGCSYRFGYHATNEFLKRNNLIGMVRAHEVQPEGFQLHFQPGSSKGSGASAFDGNGHAHDTDSAGTGGTDKRKPVAMMPIEDKHAPFVATVFSAPNYCGRFQNRAAYIEVLKAPKSSRGSSKRKSRKLSATTLAESVISPNAFEAVTSPEPLCIESESAKAFLTIEQTCPYMPTTLNGFIQRALGYAERFGTAVERQRALNDAAKAAGEPPPLPPKHSTSGSIHSIGGGSQRGSKKSMTRRLTVGSGIRNRLSVSRSKSKSGSITSLGGGKGKAKGPVHVVRGSNGGTLTNSKRPSLRQGAEGQGGSSKSPVIANGSSKHQRGSTNGFKRRGGGGPAKIILAKKSENDLFENARTQDEMNEMHPVLAEERLGRAQSQLLARVRSKAGSSFFSSPKDGSPFPPPTSTPGPASIVNEQDQSIVAGGKPPRRASKKNGRVDYGGELNDDDMDAAKLAAEALEGPGGGRSSVQSNKKGNKGRMRRSKGNNKSLTGRFVSLVRRGTKEPERRKTVYQTPADIPRDVAKTVELLVEWFRVAVPASFARPIKYSSFYEDLSDGVSLCILMSRVKGSGITSFVDKRPRKLNEFEKLENLLQFKSSCEKLSMQFNIDPEEYLAGEVEVIVPCLLELAKLACVQDDMRTTIPKQLLEKSALATYKGLLLQDRKGITKSTNQQQDDTATAFSQQELLALRLLYMMIDRHNDGHITAEELLQWAASDGPRRITREDADRCVAAVDADGDGAIGMHDFLLFAAQNKEEANEDL